jgi:hypothetical protein
MSTEDVRNTAWRRKSCRSDRNFYWDFLFGVVAVSSGLSLPPFILSSLLFFFLSSYDEKLPLT